MDDTKRDLNKKRSRTDHIKNIVNSYLQKRNYVSINLQENSTIDQQITYSLIESEISRPNSILYSCYNNDPVVIDHNFTKFLAWIRDLVKNKNTGQDIEQLVAPLFCHLYLDILKGGHSERAATFLKNHLPSIDKAKCDDFVKDLINLFANDCDATCMIEQYRSNKYFLEFSQQSLDLLKKFVVENCHVVFLHILHTWFDFHYSDNPDENKPEESRMDAKLNQNGVYLDSKFQKILDVIADVEKEPKQIFLVNITYNNDYINCALIKRSCGLLAYNQNNIIHLRPIHPYDPILYIADCNEIKLIEASSKIYSIAITENNTRLVAASEDSTLTIFNLEDMQLIKKCKGHLGPVYACCVSSNNVYVASASQDMTARLWNLDTGQTLRIFVGHTQAVTCIDFHPNCLYVVTGSADRNIRLWSVDSGNALRLFHGSKGVIYSVLFSPVGDVIASASDDKKIRIWDILTSKINSEIKYKNDPITKICFSKDGKQLCSGSLDGNLKIWDLVNNSDDNKNQEPTVQLDVNGKILAFEYSYDTFACVTN